ncbi:LPXTG cell wall anchor domain-containing protein, partial [Corynebacterium sp. HS2168-gen11]|uniref:LPXTG cell wall anchor domain-containing protein n=1 Tax=Corynebacterium sp. HS2168-gen11 TaxID=2974027 RepID=UPI00216B0B5E
PVAGVDSKSFGLVDTPQKSSDKDAATAFVPADAGKTPEEMFPKLAAIKGAGKTVEFTVSGGNPDQGEYKVDADGVVTFTPKKGFVGVADPATVTLSVKNAEGAVTGTYAAMYTPVVVPEIPSTEQIGEPGKPVNVEKPYKDIPGVVPESIGFVDPKDPTADPKDPTADPKKELKVPGEGTWKIDGDGKITFTPDEGFTKTPTPVNVGGKTKDGDPVKPGTITVIENGNPGGSSEVPDWVKKIIPFTPLLLIPLLGGIAGSSGTPVVPGSSAPGQPVAPVAPKAPEGPVQKGIAKPAVPADNGAAQKGIAKSQAAPVKGVSKVHGLANTGVSGVTAAFALAIMSMIAGLGVLVLRRNRK